MGRILSSHYDRRKESAVLHKWGIPRDGILRRCESALSSKFGFGIEDKGQATTKCGGSSPFDYAQGQNDKLFYLYCICESALVEDAHAAAPYEFFDVVDEEAVCGDRHVVRFEDGAELAGLFEVEKDFSFAWCVEQDSVNLFEQRGVGV